MKNKKQLIIYGIVLLLLFIICTELYRRMVISDPPVYFSEGVDQTDSWYYNYYSDIRLRLNMPREASYSLFLIPEFAAYDMLGESIAAWIISVYLSFFTVGTVLVVYLLLKKLCPDGNRSRLFLGSVVSMFVIPVFIIPMAQYGMRMYGSYIGSIWHNETYIGMRFFAVLILLSFYDTNDRYLERFSLKGFILQCLLFTAVNIVKPSFIIAFAPAMLIMMICDIIKAKGKGFAKWIMYGLPVLIGSAILIYQYKVLFTGTGEDSSHVIFAVGEGLKNSRFPILDFVRSYAFPLCVFVFHYKELIRSKFHLVCCLGWLFSFLEFLFLSESGDRSFHNNFGWGLCLFTFLLFCLSIGFYLNDVSLYKKNGNGGDKKRFYKLVAGKLLLIAHFISGILYFYNILIGRCAYLL